MVEDTQKSSIQSLYDLCRVTFCSSVCLSVLNSHTLFQLNYIPSEKKMEVSSNLEINNLSPESVHDPESVYFLNLTRDNSAREVSPRELEKDKIHTP